MYRWYLVYKETLKLIIGPVILTLINQYKKDLFYYFYVANYICSIFTTFLGLITIEVIFLSICGKVRSWYVNPLTLRAAKNGLMIVAVSYLQKHFVEKIWRRNVDKKSYTNSPSNILWTFALFTSYFQKYESSRR